jgi:nicotinate-nucleotide pyrophosphorylase (carboxylating)
MVRVEVEVESLDQLREALSAGADAVLLDNMGPEELRGAVEEAAGRCLTEASGGIGLEDLAAVAETGVDLISLGWITHSAPRLDVALDLD